MSSVPASVWRPALAAAGLLLLVAGPLHPRADTSRSFEQSTAAQLAHPGWIPSHALLLAVFVLLVPALIGLAGAAPSPAVRRAARFAAAGAALSVLETIFHLGAFVEAEALASGGAAPLLYTHFVLSVFSYPLIGFSLAALAWLGARHGLHPFAPLGLLGVVGGLAHGAAAPIVVATRDQRFSPLFMGVGLAALWMVVAAVLAARRPRAFVTAVPLLGTVAVALALWPSTGAAQPAPPSPVAQPADLAAVRARFGPITPSPCRPAARYALGRADIT